MYGKIAILLLKMALEIVPIFFARSKKKAEYERLIKASIYIWEKKTGIAAKLRKDHREVDEKLDKKWKDKWQNGGLPRR